jgi:hypothetical protein
MGWGLRGCSTEEDAARGCRNNDERLWEGNDGQQVAHTKLLEYAGVRICGVEAD